MTEALNIFGWAILWAMGVFVVPTIAALIGIAVFNLEQDEATATFVVVLILYWIATAIFLIIQ